MVAWVLVGLCAGWVAVRVLGLERERRAAVLVRCETLSISGPPFAPISLACRGSPV